MAEAKQTKKMPRNRITLFAAFLGVLLVIIGIKTIDDSIERGLR